MRKRILCAVCVCLLVSMALIVTIAYGNTAEQANAAKVHIVQNITQTDNVLNPSVSKSADDNWIGLENLNNLNVAVTSATDSADAVYVRTTFAFEAGNLNLDSFHDLMCIRVDSMNWSWPANDQWTEIDIEGEKYFMVTAVYRGDLGAGATTPPSLMGVGMDWSADGNALKQAGFGKEFKIYSYSQAVQVTEMGSDPAAALNSVYEEVTAEQHPWNTVYVSTWAELVKAMQEGKNAVLLDDISSDQGTLTFN